MEVTLWLLLLKVVENLSCSSEYQEPMATTRHLVSSQLESHWTRELSSWVSVPFTRIRLEGNTQL